MCSPDWCLRRHRHFGMDSVRMNSVALATLNNHTIRIIRFRFICKYCNYFIITKFTFGTGRLRFAFTTKSTEFIVDNTTVIETLFKVKTNILIFNYF